MIDRYLNDVRILIVIGILVEFAILKLRQKTKPNFNNPVNKIQLDEAMEIDLAHLLIVLGCLLWLSMYSRVFLAMSVGALFCYLIRTGNIKCAQVIDWIGFNLFLGLLVIVAPLITLWAIAQELRNIGKEVVTY